MQTNTQPRYKKCVMLMGNGNCHQSAQIRVTVQLYIGKLKNVVGASLIKPSVTIEI